MIQEKMTKDIRAVCKKLLEDKTVEVILAYKGSDVNDAQIPCFVTEPSELENIEWGNRCYSNLATYLHGLGKKAGIVAKPCDARAIVQYIAEQQLKREDVFIIGVDCMGMEDENGGPRPGCSECTVRTPPIFDEYIKDDDPAPAAAPEDSADPEKSFERFQNEIDKCILCYACRQACPGCYCKTCFIERDLPGWHSSDIDAGTKMTFHMGRAMHLAGRCVECGACEAVCQSGVDMRYITKELTKFIKDEYGYSAGMDVDQKPALLENEFEDREIGFLGGEKHV